MDRFIDVMFWLWVLAVCVPVLGIMTVLAWSILFQVVNGVM